MYYNMPVRIICQRDLINAGCFDFKSAVEIVQKALIKYSQGDVIFPDKVSVVFNPETQDRINCLPAGVISEKVYGMKWVSVFPGNPKENNKPNLSAVYVLSELESGFPIAFMEGSLCSNIRTASVGAVAAKYLAKTDSETIGFIGCGEQAKAHFLAMKEVIPSIKECRVASRTRSSEKKFIEQMKKFHSDVKFVATDGDYRAAVSGADIIVTAISGQEKILRAEWVKEGAFYCHVAGLEDDFSVALKASKIVCDNWNVVKHRTQTISQMYKCGILSDDDIYADLDEIVTGKKNGRENEDEFIYFNSVGLSFIDTELAFWMYNKCLECNTGFDVNLKSESMFDLYE